MHLHHIRRGLFWALTAGLLAVLAVGLPAASRSRAAQGATRLPPAKQAIMDRIAQHRAAALAAPKPPKVHRHVVPTPETWPSGIFQRSIAPFPSSLYTIKNQWQNVVGGAHVQVYAGTETANPSQGIVAIVTTSLDLQTVQSATYPTPSADGAVQITAANGAQLTLTTTNGSSLTFNVVTHTFQS